MPFRYNCPGQRCPAVNAMTKNLYDPSFEHDACGVGMVADLTGAPDERTVRDALTILENLEHRGATGSDADSGDGAGILIQMPDAFLRAVFDVDLPRRGHYGIAHWMVPRSSDLATLRRADRDRPFPSRSRITCLARRAGRLVDPRGDLAEPRSPDSVQQLIVRDEQHGDSDLERTLYCARKMIEHRLDIYAVVVLARRS